MQGDRMLLKLFMPQVWFCLHWNLNRNYFLPRPMIIAHLVRNRAPEAFLVNWGKCQKGGKNVSSGIALKNVAICAGAQILYKCFLIIYNFCQKICFEIHVKYINVLVHRDSRHCIARCTSRSRD